jgi:hypothetical protein
MEIENKFPAMHQGRSVCVQSCNEKSLDLPRTSRRMQDIDIDGWVHHELNVTHGGFCSQKARSRVLATWQVCLVRWTKMRSFTWKRKVLENDWARNHFFFMR